MFSLDASKAFDIVDHATLLSLLLSKRVPLCFVNIMIDWYSKLYIVVIWNDAESAVLHVRSGVRQGGVLSPILFNFYVNSLVCHLKNSDLGCHIHDLYLGCILYADDILLLSASVCMLQKMIDICVSVSQDLLLTFNSSKSHCISIGPNKGNHIARLELNNIKLEWTSKLKYLGTYLVSGSTFSICLDSVRQKYFAAANALNAHCKYVAEPVKLNLFESYCLPILMYGIDCVNLSPHQTNELNVCWNNAYRKIFGLKRYESVKTLIYFMQRIDFLRLYDLKRLIFLNKLYFNQHGITSKLLQLFLTFDDIWHLYSNYGLHVRSKPSAIKDSVYRSFETVAMSRLLLDN